MDFRDFSDIKNLADLKDKWTHTRKFVWLIGGGILILIAGFSSFYTVEADERAVVQRFGKYIYTTDPGLHFKLPLGIDKATNIKVEHVFKEEFGFRTETPGIRTQYSSKGYDDESLILTGDLNIADVEWIVQFKVQDPYKMLFKVRNPIKIIRDISEAVMRQVAGDKSITDVLTVGRVEINQEVKDRIQQTLDSYDSGIHIVTVKLQDVNPPAPVKPAFNEVNEAKQEKEKVINQSWENYNHKIPLARGEAEKAIQEAEGYSLNRINTAQGDAHRFLSIFEEYKIAVDVTKRRLYLETMSEILPKAKEKYIVDPEQKSVLPLLQLQKEVSK